MRTTIFLAANGVLFIVPILFVLNRVYEDGIVGRGALLVISFLAGTVLLDWHNGIEYELLPQTVGLVCAFAVFLCWHLLRFHRRVLRSFHKRLDGQVDRRFHET